MRQRSFILVAATVAFLIVIVVAAYAYDSSHDELIADGVTVAGVDVGGMNVVDARRKLRRELSQPLERPVKVTFAKRHFTLTPKQARLHADIRGMADEALHHSRDGTIVSRVARDITGGEENAQVPARVNYSAPAVEGFVGGVKKSLDRPPQNATLNFPSLTRVKEQN